MVMASWTKIWHAVIVLYLTEKADIIFILHVYKQKQCKVVSLDFHLRQTCHVTTKSLFQNKCRKKS